MNNLEEILVGNITLIVLGIISYYLNSFSNSGLFFGIRIPKKFIEYDEIVDLERRYKKTVIILYLSISILFNILSFSFIKNKEVVAQLLSIFMVGSILINSGIFAIYNKKIRNLKEKNNWNYKNNTVAVDTSLRKPKKDDKYKPLPNWIFIVPIFIPLIIVILTFLRQDNLSSLSLHELYRLPINMIAIVIVIYIMARVSLSSRIDINSTNLKSTIYKKKILKMLFSIIFLVTEVGLIILNSITQLGLIYTFDTSRVESILNILIAIIMIGFLIVIILMGSKGRRSIDKENTEEEVYNNDDKYWVLGMFYYNRNDPSFMIEKRAGIGYTVNFGNPKALIFFIILILFVSFISKI
ncbi:hypothetical protein E5347_07610 [Clostridium sartagoforme]|uniref:DUF5808 domain-containing protein n=1 Tax=Clostridium sartagoforme TaxID=84031 RepID=A0A4S2DKA2_9CLOT|nr:DUF5808 domain-containing protein [Clostridium sartagoforme]TGY42668.1 hypothetical protein E5347_07610 [Clostridium sartagoforme]